ncbi:MAG: hypothetical protein MK095_01655 [Phycisphaerales bacterium]|nr:hypothetical protein [Phycisphaerales bacterium]
MKRPDYLTLLLVSIVALLIWLVAEENTSEDSTINATIVFTVADSDQYIVKPDRVAVELSVSGSKQAVNGLKTVVQDALPLSLPARNGIIKIDDLKERLEGIPAIAKTGTRLQNVTPDRVDINVTELVTLKAAVRERMPEGSLVQDPVVSTKEATVTLPREEADKLPEDLTLEAWVDPRSIQHLEPGVLHTVNTAIRMPEEFASMKNVTISPVDARVSFRLVSRHRSITMDKVYVQVLANPSIADAFRVTLPDPVLRNVEVMASIEFAEQLESGSDGSGPTARVVAVLPLTNLELEQGLTEKKIAEFLVLLADGTGQNVDASVDGDAHPMVQLSVERAQKTTTDTPAQVPAETAPAVAP